MSSSNSRTIWPPKPRKVNKLRKHSGTSPNGNNTSSSSPNGNDGQSFPNGNGTSEEVLEEEVSNGNSNSPPTNTNISKISSQERNKKPRLANTANVAEDYLNLVRSKREENNLKKFVEIHKPTNSEKSQSLISKKLKADPAIFGDSDSNSEQEENIDEEEEELIGASEEDIELELACTQEEQQNIVKEIGEFFLSQQENINEKRVADLLKSNDELVERLAKQTEL